MCIRDRDNVARSQAIRRLRKEDPELLRRTPVPGLDGRDHWERWQRLLDRLEAEGVEREVWVCCRQEPLRWRAPLRADGKAAPVRVPLLPSLDAAGGEVWGRAEVREATRQARYAEAARAEGAPGAPVHGSVLLRLASDFFCYKCQKDFVRERDGDHVLPDEEVTAWWKRLQFTTKMPGLADARKAVEEERVRARQRVLAARCAAEGGNQFAEFTRLLQQDCFHLDRCVQHVHPGQRAALEPWYQRAGPDGSRLVPFPRVFGIKRSGAGGGAWFSEAVESGFDAKTFPQGRRGYYTGEPGDVPAELWLLRAWCLSLIHI